MYMYSIADAALECRLSNQQNSGIYTVHSGSKLNPLKPHPFTSTHKAQMVTREDYTLSGRATLMPCVLLETV